MTHKEICKLLEIPENIAPWTLKPLWVVQKTKIEIFVEGKRKRVFGGARVCGQCDLGIGAMPNIESISECPKCGCSLVTRTEKNPWEESG